MQTLSNLLPSLPIVAENGCIYGFILMVAANPHSSVVEKHPFRFIYGELFLILQRLVVQVRHLLTSVLAQSESLVWWYEPAAPDTATMGCLPAGTHAVTIMMMMVMMQATRHWHCNWRWSGMEPQPVPASAFGTAAGQPRP